MENVYFLLEKIMKKQLYIPNKINVGFQNREDTFTGKLAYVIYYDMKGELRKEKSWNSWRDSKIDPQEFVNEPTEGFVLNKKVGGYKSDWNFRQTYVRVYDPRNFEFEISVPNLLFILSQCDCSRGKGLEGKFVYSWEGTDLVLLPCCSEDYKNSQKYTVLQTQNVKAKELVAGNSYLTKKQEFLTFIGKFDYFCVKSQGYKAEPPESIRYIFWNGKSFVPLKNLSSIAATAQAETAIDLAELIDQYYKSTHGSKVSELFTKDIPKRQRKRDGWHDSYHWFYEESPGVYIECRTEYDSWRKMGNPVHMTTLNKIYLKEGILHSEDYYTTASVSGVYERHSWSHNKGKWVEPTFKALWARLASGSVYKVKDDGLIDPNLKKEEEDGEED